MRRRGDETLPRPRSWRAGATATGSIGRLPGRAGRRRPASIAKTHVPAETSRRLACDGSPGGRIPDTGRWPRRQHDLQRARLDSPPHTTASSCPRPPAPPPRRR
jgi:hypothetical protein